MEDQVKSARNAMQQLKRESLVGEIAFIARSVKNISKQEPGQLGTSVQNSIHNFKMKYNLLTPK